MNLKELIEQHDSEKAMKAEVGVGSFGSHAATMLDNDKTTIKSRITANSILRRTDISFSPLVK